MGVFVGYFKDPVFQRNEQWFFWDKNWTLEIGPFNTEAIARKALDRYILEASPNGMAAPC